MHLTKQIIKESHNEYAKQKLMKSLTKLGKQVEKIQRNYTLALDQEILQRYLDKYDEMNTLEKFIENIVK